MVIIVFLIYYNLAIDRIKNNKLVKRDIKETLTYYYNIYNSEVFGYPKFNYTFLLPVNRYDIMDSDSVRGYTTINYYNEPV